MKPRSPTGQKARRAAIFAAPLACAAFAAWPLEPTHLTPTAITQPETAKRQVASLDLAAFRIPLWVAEPAPPAPSAPLAPAAPPPPLKLRLLAIIHEGEIYKAAVYDPDSDKILVVAAGEKIGIRNVDKVDKSTLTLQDHTGKRVLALKAGGQGS